MKILITGAAGFIGMHVSKAYLSKKNIVYGIDNISSSYDKNLKLQRLKILKKYKNFRFTKIDISSDKFIKKIQKIDFDLVIHLAAQAGVRDNLYNPKAYYNSNIKGFFNILELSKIKKIKLLLYASSSSVYGNTKSFSENDSSRDVLNFYAASKKANEIMASAYSSLFGITTIGLRFFSVYGPWGRPDMAPYIFIDSLYKSKKIKLINKGQMFRDFTYIDDVVDGILKLQIYYQRNQDIVSNIINLGSSKRIKVNKFLKIIESVTNKKARIMNTFSSKGEMLSTKSKNNKINKLVGFSSKFDVNEGIKKTVQWYKKEINNKINT